jgi:uncharacterized membrane protein YtjA (UPF0391 family)
LLARRLLDLLCIASAPAELKKQPAGLTLIRRNNTMLRLALLFLVIALIAALLGFGGIAALSFEGAKILFFVFIVLAIVAAIGGALRGYPPA